MLTNRSKLVVKKEMNFWERIYLPAILDGGALPEKMLDGNDHTAQNRGEVNPLPEIHFLLYNQL